MTIRTCSKCGETKPLTAEHFQADRQKSSGFRPDCKACRHAGYARKRPKAPRLLNRALAADGMKLCCACEVVKPLSEFHVRAGVTGGAVERCKPCKSAYVKQLRASDTAAFDAPAKAYKARNRDKVRERARLYAARRRAQDPKARFRGSVGRLVGCFLKRRGLTKGGRSFLDAVGYSALDLARHVERQFLAGMTWDNYGEWHLEHVIPNARFDYSSMEDDDFKACWALSNLRPLWALDNLKKADKVLTLL